MIEYVIGGVLHGADTKDQIKVGGNIPYFDSLEFFDKMDLESCLLYTSPSPRDA